MQDIKRVICIVGPTASGKTALSISLAKALHTEIVSADSVQVFRGMDIGSAKPTMEEREGIPHHMIDCLDIDAKGFSVSMFRDMAFPILDSLNAAGKIPLVVGGSGLYVSAITDPLTFAVPSDPKIRKALEDQYATDREGILSDLQSVDPISAARLHPNDAKRIIRALEVYKCSGVPLSSYGNDFRNEAQAEAPYHSLQIGLLMNRELLYDRINQRVNQMLANGLLEEAERIYKAGYDRKLPAMLSIGYRQLFSFFDGQLSLHEAVELIKQETRRFAKRQMTWFKRDSRIHWIETSGTAENSVTDQALELCCKF